MADENEQKPVVTQTDASPAPDTEVDQTLAEVVASDLQATGLPTKGQQAKPEDEEAPDIGEQEDSDETGDEPEHPEGDDTAESDSQAGNTTVETETTQKKPDTQKRVKTLIGKLKAKDAEAQGKELELQKLRASIAARTNAPLTPVQRPQEQTPEYWSQQYWQRKREGIPDDDPRQQEAIARHDQCKDEVLAERIEQRQAAKAQVQHARARFDEALLEIHRDNPCLVPADNALGYELDAKSPLVTKMNELAAADGVALMGNAVAIILYAQRADRILLRQQLDGSTSDTETLKRKQAEAIAKGTVASGKRPAPTPAKAKSRQMAELERRAATGSRQAREALGQLAVAADLGL